MSGFEAQIPGNDRSIEKMYHDQAAYFSLKVTGHDLCSGSLSSLIQVNAANLFL